MPTIRFEGKTIQLPEGVTLDEVREILNRLSGFEEDAGLLETLRRHEGSRSGMYRDSEGFATIGVGFNLDARGATSTLKQLLGFTSKQVFELTEGKRGLNNGQITTLLKSSLQTAKVDARSIFKNFDTRPKKVQEVLINMAFNLGKGRLSKFKNFVKAIDSGNYNQATFEMLNNKRADGTVEPTPWANQVKGRALELAGIVHSFGQPGTAGGTELEDFLPQPETAPLAPVPVEAAPAEQVQQAPTPAMQAPTPLNEAELQQEALFISKLPETMDEEKSRQRGLRERLGIGEFAESGRMDPGFFQRDNGSFFEITPEGGVLEHGN